MPSAGSPIRSGAAIDGSGDVWVTNPSTNSVTELNSGGAAVSPTDGPEAAWMGRAESPSMAPEISGSRTRPILRSPSLGLDRSGPHSFDRLPERFAAESQPDCHRRLGQRLGHQHQRGYVAARSRNRHRVPRPGHTSEYAAGIFPGQRGDRPSAPLEPTRQHCGRESPAGQSVCSRSSASGAFGCRLGFNRPGPPGLTPQYFASRNIAL